MAKVTGPLMSIDARGAIGKALVFIGWKGIKDVRQWLRPANPQSAAQGNIRCIIGGTGRAAGMAVYEEPYVQKMVGLGVIPDQQSQQSYLVKYIKDTFISGSGATMTGNYATVLAELTGHTVYTAWQTGADDLGLSDFSLSYDSIATFEKALGVYLLAKAAIALGFTGSPYTKTLANWTGAHIDKLVNHLEA